MRWCCNPNRCLYSWSVFLGTGVPTIPIFIIIIITNTKLTSLQEQFIIVIHTMAEEVDQCLWEMCTAVEVRHTLSTALTVLILLNTAHSTGALEYSAWVSCFFVTLLLLCHACTTFYSLISYDKSYFIATNFAGWLNGWIYAIPTVLVQYLC